MVIRAGAEISASDCVCSYDCTVYACAQTFLIDFMHLCMRRECKESDAYTGASISQACVRLGTERPRAEGKP